MTCIATVLWLLGVLTLKGAFMRRTHLRRSLPALILLALLLPLLGGCASRAKPVHDPSPATAPVEVVEADQDAFALEEEFVEHEAQETFDPLSGYNRVMTQVNDRVYFWALKPVARGYRAVVPTPLTLPQKCRTPKPKPTPSTQIFPSFDTPGLRRLFE